jgi:hypothetical protein
VSFRISLIIVLLIAASGAVDLYGDAYSMAEVQHLALHPLISRVLYDDINDGEFFSIINPSQSAIAISDWTVSDGEGTATFPSGSEIPAGGEITVARNASCFIRQNGRYPDYSLLQNNLGIITLQQSGTFRLANSGDELSLADEGGQVMDAVVFGKSGEPGSLYPEWLGQSVPSPGKSRILVRQSDDAHPMDSNTNADWLAVRDYRPGQSSFPPCAASAKVTCLLMPDHSNRVIERVNEAKSSLAICSYEFDSWQMFSAINKSLSNGVRVEILLERSPAGGISNRSAWILSKLEEGGAEIHFMRSPSDKDSMRRYSYVHSKYIVIDCSCCIVLSENLVYNAFDTELGRGNRGWAAIAESRELASSLLSVFNADTNERFPDIGTFDLRSPIEPPPGTITEPPHRIVGKAPVTSNCSVTLFTFPDCTGRTTVIQGLIGRSETSLYAELFYADTVWSTPMLGEIESPLLTEMISLAGRAAEFLVCLDNSSFLSDGGNRNQQALSSLSAAIPAKCNGSMVGFPPGNAPFDIVHNKGMVLDHRYSWISSVNWNYESICANREIALLVDDPAIAAFCESCIGVDLEGEANPPVILPEIGIESSSSAWKLTLSDLSDDTGIMHAELTTEDGERHLWSCEIPFGSSNVRVTIKATDLWGNVAECEVQLFPTELPADERIIGMSPGMVLSWSSAVTMLAMAYLRTKAWVRGRKRGCRPHSNVIYGCSRNSSAHDDKGIRLERRIQSSRHHARHAEGGLSTPILPERCELLARRLPHRGEGRGDSRLHNGRHLERAPVEDPDARRHGSSPQVRGRLRPDKGVHIVEHAEGDGHDRPRGEGQQRDGGQPILEAGLQNNRIHPRILQGRGGRH